MRLKNAVFAIGFLSVSFWLHGSAMCETSPAPPLSLAPPLSATAKDTPPPAATSVWPPMATDDVPLTAKRPAPSATAKSSPSPKPAADYDGLTVDIVDDDTSGQTTQLARPRAPKQPQPTQKPDSIQGPSARQQSVDQVEDDKLRRKLTICSGCKG